MAPRLHLKHLIYICIGLILPIGGPACASTIFFADIDGSSAAMFTGNNRLIQPIAEFRPPSFDKKISISPNILRLDDDSMTMIVVTPDLVLAAQVP